MLALHGFDTVGLDISPKGISIAEEYAGKELQAPQAYNFGPAWANKSEKGSASFIQGDFFQSDSVKGKKFDVIYDYTVSNGICRFQYEPNTCSFFVLCTRQCGLSGPRVWLTCCFRVAFWSVWNSLSSKIPLSRAHRGL